MASWGLFKAPFACYREKLIAPRIRLKHKKLSANKDFILYISILGGINIFKGSSYLKLSFTLSEGEVELVNE